jgi:DNA-directed RNA polymerase subunit alpha
MIEQNIAIPSKPKIISEENFKGIYEIDGLYPGYGHTLGNSLRRIILSSLPGTAITEVKISGVGHEFSTIEGIKEDVISIILNLKKIRLSMHNNEPIRVSLHAKGPKKVTAADFELPSQITIINKDQYLFEITTKVDITIEIKVENGIGFVPKEVLHKDKVDVGTIALDASFTPIRRVNYEAENMRVGDRTDYNRLRITIETDGTITPKEALEQAVVTMLTQLKAIVGFKEEVEIPVMIEKTETEGSSSDEIDVEDFLKTRIEDLELSARTINALSNANIRTVGGLARKKASDILEIEGFGQKGLSEIKELLAKHNIELKD